MTFTYMRKKKLTGSAFAAALVLTAGALTACGGDDEAGSADDSAMITDAAGAADAAGLEGSEALQAIQVKAEDYGYEDCMMAPADSDDLTTVRLTCVETGLPQLSLYDRQDRGSGSEIVEAEIDEIMEYAGEVSREVMGSDYRALEGEEIVGSCREVGDGCDETAEALGLDATLPEGALTSDELEQKRDEDRELEAREYEEKQKREEEEKQRELQNYSGWEGLGQAREQLAAWDLSCREDPAAEGKVAWCDLRSVLVAFGMSADDLEKEDVFKEVGRDEMTSVSDGDWTVMCAPGAEDKCDLISDKTGKSVKDGV